MNINEIKTDEKYEGYLWLSDSDKPIVLDRSKELRISLKEEKSEGVLNENVNPFVIEGYLYAAKKSYTIKYVDGEAKVNVFDVPDNIPAKEKKEYYANRMGDKAVLMFWDKWSPVPDQQCLGMEVLQPEAKVFIGFKK